MGTPAKERERLDKRALRAVIQCGPEGDGRVLSPSGKMSRNNSLTGSGQDLTSSGNRAQWEDARMALKPSTPTRKPKPVSTAFRMQHPLTGAVPMSFHSYVKYQSW